MSNNINKRIAEDPRVSGAMAKWLFAIIAYRDAPTETLKREKWEAQDHFAKVRKGVYEEITAT